MPYIIGVVLALLVAAFARVVGLDRDRAFYPTVMIVIAAIYVLFAVIGGSMQAVVVESVIMSAFVLMAVLGFKKSLWLVAIALVAHGVMDAFHGSMVSNPGVPAFWPAFCASYDVVAGGYLGWVLWRSEPKTGFAAVREGA